MDRDRAKRKVFLDLLRKLSKRGFYETLQFICEKGSAHYVEILNHDMDNGIVKSRATVTLIIRSLSSMGLVRRTILDTRPVRTIYEPTEKGLKLLRHLKDIEKL